MRRQESSESRRAHRGPDPAERAARGRTAPGQTGRLRRGAVRALPALVIVASIQLALLQSAADPVGRSAAARAEAGQLGQPEVPTAATATAATPTSATPIPAASPAATPTTGTDPGFFPETGFSVDPAFDPFFRAHGGARTFGPPISNRFRLLGREVQLFRDFGLAQSPGGAPTPLALLDSGAVPSLRVGGRVLPDRDPTIAGAGPAAGTPDYATQALAFIRATVPDAWEGEPVGFQRAFLATVTPAAAAAGGDPALPAGSGLEVWGLPVSGPSRDPRDPEVVYLRWEYGVMEYDGRTTLVRAVPLGELFRAVLTGQGLPPDLAADAQGSRFYLQADPTAPDGVARPAELPDTSLREAFQPAGPTPATTPVSTGEAPAAIATPSPTLGADPCHGDEQISYVPEDPRAGNELLIAVTSAGPHPYPRLAGTERTTFVRERPGQHGYVWEWTVELSYPGAQTYTFYADSTVRCTEVSLRVGQALATSTPKPAFGSPADNSSGDNSADNINGDNS